MAFTYLLKNRKALSSHDITVKYTTSPFSPVFPYLHYPVLLPLPVQSPSVSEILTHHVFQTNKITSFIPVFLGGINHGSGNKPPWHLPAKAEYGKYDLERTKIYHDLTQLKTPKFFPPNTLLVCPSFVCSTS